MRPDIERAVRLVAQAVADGDLAAAVTAARAAYRVADEDGRRELLLYLGPRAATEPLN
ncbi:hypothetical protein [Streptomyces macrosporus]|uniref:Uncharacterized protein n=1 Tax=Streptomyces macrosporus TaxID=44032 RepID=A0ABN3JCI5_9ACTN